MQAVPLCDLSVPARLHDAPSPGAPAKISAEAYCQITALICQPPETFGRPITHWSARELADEANLQQIIASISPRQVGRFLKEADLSVMRGMDLDLPEGSVLYADKAYTDYAFEDLLQEAADGQLLAHRKKNSKRAHPAWEQYICQRSRRQIETTFSQIALRFSRSIHAVTARDFELKVFLTVLAYAICG